MLIEKWAKDCSENWARETTEKDKEKICELLGASKYDLQLCGNVHEAHFQVLFAHYVDFIRETGRTHILALETETSSILEAIKRLEKFEVQRKILNVNEHGQLTGQALHEAIRARSGLLSISMAQPCTGVIQPVQELISICKQHDIRVHLDVTTAMGKLDFRLDDFDADYVTFDGSLLHAPTQISAIFSKKRIGTSHEFPYSDYSVLGDAIQSEWDKIDHYAMEIGYLRDLLEGQLKECGGTIFFKEVERLPNTAVIAFEDIHAEKLLHQLKRQGSLQPKFLP